MKLKVMGSFAAVSLMLLSVRPATAHHSFDAEYDSKRTTTISGTVTKLDWVNPHAFVFIDAKDEAGTVKSFKIEMGRPKALVRAAGKPEPAKAGAKVQAEPRPPPKDARKPAGA